MKRSLTSLGAVGLFWTLWTAMAAPVFSADAAPTPAAPKYALRYKFTPGETLRWSVEHRAQVRSTVAGTTQTADTVSHSVKVWRVLEPAEAGLSKFEHSVASVEMRQQVSGHQEITYNSETDTAAPPGFQDVAKAVGVPLSVITLNGQGEVQNRDIKLHQPSDSNGQVTITLPAEPVAVGESWSFPYDIDVPLQSGVVKKIATRQRFELESVIDGIATIRLETVILTPVHDPAVEAQLIQRQSVGKMRFDIERGLVVGQQTDLDKRVIGFQGEGSSLHYQTRFVEELISDSKAAVASKPVVAGPAPPPLK